MTKTISDSVIDYEKVVNRKLEKTRETLEKEMGDLIVDIMGLFRWWIGNGNLTGFSFEGTMSKIDIGQPFNVLRIQSSFLQIDELTKMQEDLQELFYGYVDEETICVEFVVDDEGLYIEIIIDNFT